MVSLLAFGALSAHGVLMGKPEKGPSSGQSIEQLLSSIRLAIEADSAPAPATNGHSAGPASAVPASAVAATAEPVPGKVPRAPRISSAGARQSERPHDETSSDGSRSYRYRYALDGSKTYSGLRDRLSSLSKRTKGQTSRSMASVLGGDDPQLKGSQEQDLASADDACFTGAAEVEAQTGEELDLRSTFPPVAPEAQPQGHLDPTHGAPQQQQDYLQPYQEQQWQQPHGAPVEASPVVLPGADVSGPVDVHEPEFSTPVDAQVAPAPDDTADYTAADAAIAEAEHGTDPQLPLDAMIRQIIEPELYLWFDEHMPEHVARAMPDEEGFIAMIRPLIEDWLEENLSTIVEAAVRDEIARITGLKR